MNKFNHIDFKNNSLAIEMAKEFDSILDKIWCKFTFERGLFQWHRVMKKVEQPFARQISVEIGHVDLGHDVVNARLAVKEEMEKYLEYLILIGECKVNK